MARPVSDKPDILEHGANGQTSDRRVFMQLKAFTGCPDTAMVIESLQRANIPGALYEDVNDPIGIAVVTYTEDPADFVGPIRRLYQGEPFVRFEHRPQFTMLGRSYALGYEQDLEDTLIHRPIRTLLNPDWPWAIWYPLRRKGGFTQLPPDEQRAILMEHGKIGMAYGSHDLAHDIRLLCHGLDASDNDFVIGLMGKQLTPLSKIVENMRQTKQTSTWLEKLGPFFVGRKVWQSASE